MGLDFICRTKRSFRKGLDSWRVQLATPPLFLQSVTETPRSYSVTLNGRAHTLEENAEVLVCLKEHEKIVIMKGMDEIGLFIAPTKELVEALKTCGGEACGIVEVLHEKALVAEISVC